MNNENSLSFKCPCVSLEIGEAGAFFLPPVKQISRYCIDTRPSFQLKLCATKKTKSSAWESLFFQVQRISPKENKKRISLIDKKRINFIRGEAKNNSFPKGNGREKRIFENLSRN